MLLSLTTLFATLFSVLPSRSALRPENLTLRHQIGIGTNQARARIAIKPGITTTMREGFRLGDVEEFQQKVEESGPELIPPLREKALRKKAEEILAHFGAQPWIQVDIALEPREKFRQVTPGALRSLPCTVRSCAGCRA